MPDRAGIPECNEDGLRPGRAAALERRVARARLAEARRADRMSEARAQAAARLKGVVPGLGDMVEKARDEQKPSMLLRGSRLLLDIANAKVEQPKDAEPEKPAQHLHIHVTPDTLDAAIDHLQDARRGERVNGRDEAGGGNGSP